MKPRARYDCRDCDRSDMSPGDSMVHATATGHDIQTTRIADDSGRNADHEGEKW